MADLAQMVPADVSTDWQSLLSMFPLRLSSTGMCAQLCAHVNLVHLAS